MILRESRYSTFSPRHRYPKKSDPPSHPARFTFWVKTIQSDGLLIEGGLREGDACTINGRLQYTARSEDVEKDSGDYWSVTESWISETNAGYTITGTGKVSYMSTFDNNLGNIRLMVLDI